MVANTRVEVEVRVSPTLDYLALVPASPKDLGLVRAALRAAFPGAWLGRDPIAAHVAGREAAQLLAGLEGLELSWTEFARVYALNRVRARANHARLRDELNAIRARGPKHARLLISDLKGAERLDDHQLVNVAGMTLPEGFGLCVFDEQGAGKTVTTIHAFDLLAARDEADIAFVVAPKSMVPEWPVDLKRFKGDLYRIQILSGSYSEKFSDLSSRSDFFVTNFETVVAMESQLTTFLRRHKGRAVLIIDESYFIKSLDARRTQALRRMREWCRRAFVLCGAPAPNAPHDLIQQFNLVDFGLTFEGLAIPKERDLARAAISDAIEERGLYLRHLKRDVLPELPGKVFTEILVPMQPLQSRAYANALNSLIIDLEATDDEGFQRQLASFLARRMALLQICSNPRALVPGYRETPAKLLALDSIVEELVGQRAEKLVIWSFFTESIDAIVQRYAPLRPLRYDGTVSDVGVRRESVRSFQEDPSRRLFVGNPAAGGAGLTLHSARFAVYESLSNQAAHYLQSVDRIHRRGQTRSVEYLILLCDQTIELNEYARLVDKERAGQNLLGDRNAQRITRQTLLAEARDASRALGIESNV